MNDRRPAIGGVTRARHLRKTMTVAERRLWKVLRTFGLNIRRQAPIGPYVVDFVSHSARLVIEVDGYRHTLPDAEAHDAERTRWLNGRGYKVIRIPEKDAREQTERVAGQIRALLDTPNPDPSPFKGEGNS